MAKKKNKPEPEPEPLPPVEPEPLPPVEPEPDLETHLAIKEMVEETLEEEIDFGTVKCFGCPNDITIKDNSAVFFLNGKPRPYHLDCFIHKATRLGLANFLGLN